MKKKKSEYIKRKEKYKFDLRENVKYVGIVFEQYKNKIGIIETRLSPSDEIWYDVKFNDGKVLMLMESTLRKCEEGE